MGANLISLSNWPTLAEYSITDDSNEIFTIDDLGNRDSVNVRDTNDVNYDIDNLTNRYDKVGDANLTYDAAGNPEIDKDGYQYEYDYENRIVKITRDPNDTVVAEFAYDALASRIKRFTVHKPRTFTTTTTGLPPSDAITTIRAPSSGCSPTAKQQPTTPNLKS